MAPSVSQMCSPFYIQLIEISINNKIKQEVATQWMKRHFFEHKNVKKVVGKPTRDEIKIIQDFIQDNTAGVPCELGGGKHGYLVITMLEIDHASATIEYFKEYANPGPLNFIPENATHHQAKTAKEQHKRESRLFKEERHAERHLRNKTVKDFDETYLLKIKEYHIG